MPKQHITYYFANENMKPSGNHVLVITRYRHQWLLVHHKKRGIEFCGGKLEYGETSYQAAIRESLEELGAIIEEKDLIYIGQYQVEEKNNAFTKDVFYTEVLSLQQQLHYFETWGPVLYDSLADIPIDKQSFILKDEVVRKMVAYIVKNIM